jgi:hypothetical protein
MKISARSLAAWNKGLRPKANECWNKANGLPSIIEATLLSMISNSLFGVAGKRRNITQKDIKEYVPYSTAQIEWYNKYYKNEVVV